MCNGSHCYFHWYIFFQSILFSTSVIGTPDIIFDGIRFGWYWLHSTHLSSTNNVSEYNIPIMFQNAIYEIQCKVSTESLNPIFPCIVNEKRTWSFDYRMFASSAVIFCIICNIFCAFDLDLGNNSPLFDYLTSQMNNPWY